MKTPYERWVERTEDGHKMAAKWVSAKHTPSRRGEYEVRGAGRTFLTWVYGHWWHMEMGTNNIPYWYDHGEARYGWKRDRECDNTSIHGADLLIKAAALNNPEAQEELAALKVKCEREYKERWPNR